jgi:diguanylate cyclase (GGDEF)-like protein/PAS domain S-box-containing protein
MLKDFVTNASLLIASFFLIGQVYKRWPMRPKSGMGFRAITGILFGLQGILLMFYSIRVSETVLIDLRHVPIIIAALFGGWPAAVISTAIIVIGRISIGLTFSSLLSAAGMLLACAFCMMLAAKHGLTLRRFLLLNAATELILSTVIWVGLSHTGSSSMIPVVVSSHVTASMLVGLLSAYVFQYIIRSNEFNRILQENEENYRKLIAGSPDATFVHSEKSIVFVNQKGLELLQAPSSREVIGRSVFEFIHPAHQKEARKQWRHLTEHSLSGDRLEQKYVRLNGEEMDVEMSVSPITFNGKAAFLATLREITDRKATERKLQEAMAQLQRLSDLDGLTGIPNRRRFDHVLEQAWEESAGKSQHLSLVFFDVDYFKRYNDTYGHQGGDEVLRKIASVLREALDDDSQLAARYGGEEFAIILTNTRIQVAKETAELIRTRIEALAIPHLASKIAKHVTISLGVASVIPHLGVPRETLLQMADRALYQAKTDGRNRVIVYHTAEG